MLTGDTHSDRCVVSQLTAPGVCLVSQANRALRAHGLDCQLWRSLYDARWTSRFGIPDGVLPTRKHYQQREAALTPRLAQVRMPHYPDTEYSLLLQVEQDGALVFEGETRFLLRNDAEPPPPIVIQNGVPLAEQTLNHRPANYRKQMTSAQQQELSNLFKREETDEVLQIAADHSHVVDELKRLNIHLQIWNFHGMPRGNSIRELPEWVEDTVLWDLWDSVLPHSTAAAFFGLRATLLVAQHTDNAIAHIWTSQPPMSDNYLYDEYDLCAFGQRDRSMRLVYDNLPDIRVLNHIKGCSQSLLLPMSLLCQQSYEEDEELPYYRYQLPFSGFKSAELKAWQIFTDKGEHYDDLSTSHDVLAALANATLDWKYS